MSLIICPECAREVSSAAAACPNCGHPFVRPPVVQPRVVVREVVEEDGGFPKWAFIPLGLLGIVLLFVLFAFLRNGNEDEAQRNINVKIASQPSASNSRETTARSDATPNQVIVPPTSQPNQVVLPPATSTTVPATTTTTTAIPQNAAPDKGTVSLEAKIAGKTGGAQPVRNVKFYLLKKDVDTILRDADIENDTGQAMLTALGMSVVFPNEYGDLNRRAFAAIGKETAYNITTDGGGKAQFKDIKPDNYYLFAVTKTGSGYTLWNSPVTIQSGQNSLILPPATPTEVTQE